MTGIVCSMVGASFAVAAAAEVIRLKKGITAVGNAQIDTAQSKFGGSSALFDGTGDYLTVGNDVDNDMALTSTTWTVEYWARINAHAGAYQGTIGIWDPSGSTGSVWYVSTNAYNGTNKMGIAYTYGTNSTSGDIAFGSALSTGVWQHHAFVRNGNTLTAYLDGVSQGTHDMTGRTIDITGFNNSTNTTLKMTVGALTGGAGAFNGHLDEIRISKSARYTANFTPSTTPFVNDDNTVLLIHANGTDASTYFEDDNGIRPPIALIGNGNAQISTAQSKFGGSSYLGDGTGDYIRADGSISLGTGDFTIEMWARHSVVNTNQMYMDCRPTNVNGAYPGIFFLGSNSRPYYYFNTNTRITADSAMSANTWYHIAMVRSSGVTKMYINGTAQTTTYTDSSSISYSIAHIGASNDSSPSQSLNGHIDEVRVSNTARYTANFTPATQPFVNDANTLMLIHMDGTNASTVFCDDNGLIPTTYTSDVVAFDGTGDYYEATSLSSSATADSKYAVIAINFYWAGGTNLQHPLNLRLGTGSGDLGFWTWINGGRNQLKFVYGDGSNPGSIYENAENSLTANAWNQAVFFIDTTSSANCQIWTNGNLKAHSSDGIPTNVNFNWTNTASTIKIGQKNTTQVGTGADFNGRISQVYISAASSFPGIEYFWDKSTNRPKDFGTDGRATGLAQPLIYHYGGTSTFPTNRGNFASYTLTANGNVTTNAANTIYARARRQAGIVAFGNAQVDTAQSKFGGASALFDGTGDYLRVYELPAIGTGDFTVEFWFRPNYSSSPNMLLWDNRGSISTSAGAQLINFIGASPVINYWVAGSYRITGTTVLSSGTWYHIAVSRSGTSTKMFINGTQEGSTYTDSNSYVSNPGQYIGIAYDGGASTNGHIDEFRVSNTARYTVNFTAPSAPSQNDNNTLVLLHMDGTDASTVFFDDNGRDTTPTT